MRELSYSPTVAEMSSRELAIEMKELGAKLPSGFVRALLDRPRGEVRESAILFAHGAELDFASDFMQSIAERLAVAGFAVLRFRYPYMERRERESKKFPPDRMPLLEEAHFRALDFARRELDARRILLAGKSMGARVSTHLAAKGADAAGLVLFGYPLQAAGKPTDDRNAQRREHFPAIVQPALFLQGTRDPLCDLAKLRGALKNFGGHATIAVIDDADHAFEVRKSSGRDRNAVRDELVRAVDQWERASFPD